jgi:hypothetical protein
MPSLFDIMGFFFGASVLLLLQHAGTEIFRFVLREEGLKRYASIFALIFWASLAAAIFSKFNSCLLFVPFLFYFFYVDREKLRTVIKQKHLIFSNFRLYIVSILYFILFSVLFLFIFFPSDGHFVMAYPDVYAYINQINLMENLGKETFFSELENGVFGQFVNIRPYHYFEFWICILFKKITGLNSYFVYSAFLPSFFASVFFNLIFSFISEKKSGIISSTLIFILPMAIFTTCRFIVLDDVPVAFLDRIFSGLDQFNRAVLFQNFGTWHFFSYMHGTKLLISCLFVFPVFLLIYEKQYRLIPYFGAILPIISIAYFPFFLVLNFFLLLLSWFSKRNFLSIKLQAASVLPFGLFYLIHFLLNEKTGSLANPVLIEISIPGIFGQIRSFLLSFTFEIFNQYFYVFFIGFFILMVFRGRRYFPLFGICLLYFLVLIDHKQLFKVYLLVVLMVFLFYWRFILRSSFLFYFLFLWFCLLIGVSCLSFIVDSFQFFSLISIPFFYFLILIFCLRAFRPLPLIRQIGLCLLLMVWTGNNFISIFQDNRRACQVLAFDDFYKSMVSRLSGDDFHRAVFYCDYSLLPYIHYNKTGMELLNFTDKLYSTGMNISRFSPENEDLIRKTNAEVFLSELPFYRFSKRFMSAKGENPDSAFIASKGIKMVFADNRFSKQRLTFLRGFPNDSLVNTQLGYTVYFIK